MFNEELVRVFSISDLAVNRTPEKVSVCRSKINCAPVAGGTIAMQWNSWINY